MGIKFKERKNIQISYELLASGIFLRIEIKSTGQKMPSTTTSLSFRLGLPLQPSWGSPQPGQTWQAEYARERVSRSALLSPQNSASDNSNRIPEKL